MINKLIIQKNLLKFNNKGIKMVFENNEFCLFLRFAGSEQRDAIFNVIVEKQPELKEKIEKLKNETSPFQYGISHLDIKNIGLDEVVDFNHVKHFLFNFPNDLNKKEIEDRLNSSYVYYLKNMLDKGHDFIKELEHGILKFDDSLGYKVKDGTLRINDLIKLYFQHSKQPKFDILNNYKGNLTSKMKAFITQKMEDDKFHYEMLNSKFFKENLNCTEFIHQKYPHVVDSKEEDFQIDIFTFSENFYFKPKSMYLNFKKENPEKYKDLNITSVFAFEEDLLRQIFIISKNKFPEKKIMLNKLTAYELLIMSKEGDDVRLSPFFKEINKNKDYLLDIYLNSKKTKLNYESFDGAIEKIFNYSILKENFALDSVVEKTKKHKI